MWYAIFGALGALIIWKFMAKSRYYGQIFSEENFNEIGEWVYRMLQLDEVANPSVEDGTAYQTAAGLGLVFTRMEEDGNDTIHFSVSQSTGYTTHAVGGRVIFLIISMIKDNECEASLYYTETSVHHAVFYRPEKKEWTTRPVKEAVKETITNYQPPPIQLIKVFDK